MSDYINPETIARYENGFGHNIRFFISNNNNKSIIIKCINFINKNKIL